MATKDPFALEPIPRRVTHLIFMVDTSGSMSGSKIASLNTAVRDALDDVGDISKNCGDSQIKIAVLEFSSAVNWMYEQPLEAEKFQWQDLSASGTTSFGSACAELDAKLSRSNGFMGEKTGCRAPAIVLLSDGAPTDGYVRKLEKLKGNRWFKAGVKVAIAIGDDANNGVLQEFTGSSESVITVHNVDQLKKMIHTVSVSATTVASQSASVGAAMVTQNQLVAQSISNTVVNDASLSGVDVGSSKANSGSDDWSGWN
jgi:uncharacterized protein YegL